MNEESSGVTVGVRGVKRVLSPCGPRDVEGKGPVFGRELTDRVDLSTGRC